MLKNDEKYRKMYLGPFGPLLHIRKYFLGYIYFSWWDFPQRKIFLSIFPMGFSPMKNIYMFGYIFFPWGIFPHEKYFSGIFFMGRFSPYENKYFWVYIFPIEGIFLMSIFCLFRKIMLDIFFMGGFSPNEFFWGT